MAKKRNLNQMIGMASSIEAAQRGDVLYFRQDQIDSTEPEIFFKMLDIYDTTNGEAPGTENDPDARRRAREHYRLAAIEFKTGSLPSAIAILQKAYEADPSYKRVRNQLRSDLREWGDLLESVMHF